MIPQPKQNVQEISPYVPGKPIEEVRRELGLKGEILKLASNENPLGPSPLALAALRQGLTGVHLYPDDSCYYLGRRLAGHLGVAEDQLIFGNGAVEVIDFVMKSYVSPGDHVVLADQSFIMYAIAAKVAGARATVVPLRDHTHDLDAMARAVDARTKVVFVVNPNNPTGTAFGQRQASAFLRKVPRSCLVVFDEAYYEYVDDPAFPDSIGLLAEHPNLIVLRTFSKIYGLAGLRVGYGIGHPDLIAAIRKVRLPFNVGLLSQLACRAAIGDRRHVARSRRVNAAGKKYLYARFQALGVPAVPSQGNFILIDTGRDSQPVFLAMQQLGVIVRPVKNYGMPTQLRVTVGTPPQNRRLVAALKKALAGRSR
ncbi:MAG: histidinol-phosphate transaminase [Candidatus Edwardsbacteria bacterium]|jgi:histidinol-phosphate aminotransferase|nr:histidinol-phosphate transaminase [Candidatus Edwardsbacteria bacterium]